MASRRGFPSRVDQDRALRHRLVDFAAGRGDGGTLDPEALTIAFSRRFAPYKRATLLLSDRERLSRLLGDAARPVQFLFSGKAHPADMPGKVLLGEIVATARAEARFAFLEDYDIDVARATRLPTLSAIGSGRYTDYLGSANKQFGPFAPNVSTPPGSGSRREFRFTRADFPPLASAKPRRSRAR